MIGDDDDSVSGSVDCSSYSDSELESSSVMLTQNLDVKPGSTPCMWSPRRLPALAGTDNFIVLANLSQSRN
jgi:hypothetical protein